MRLAQLARKVSVKSTAIVDFLAAQAVVIEDNPNTKIEEEYVRTILAHFAPALLEAEIEVEVLATTQDAAIAVVEAEPQQEVVQEQLPVMTTEESVAEASITPTTVTEELPDIIRAPKIELSGLKVLGKIELPEKKKKEEPEAGATGDVLDIESTEPRFRPREKKLTDRKRAERPKRNPLSEARERERREQEEKRKAEEEKRKELRKQKYLQTRQAKAPTRTEKVKVEKEVKKAPAKKKKEESISLLTRFLRWLTSNQT
jgi:hypothetical protein